MRVRRRVEGGWKWQGSQEGSKEILKKKGEDSIYLVFSIWEKKKRTTLKVTGFFKTTSFSGDSVSEATHLLSRIPQVSWGPEGSEGPGVCWRFPLYLELSSAAGVGGAGRAGWKPGREAGSARAGMTR